LNGSWIKIMSLYHHLPKKFLNKFHICI